MIARMSERGGGKQAGVGAVAVLACAVFASPAAWAQSSAPDSPRTVPEQIAPPAESGPAGNAAPAPVIVPPAVDPGIKAPVKTPTHDNLLVVPPPGTPGGDPHVIPK